MQTCRQIELNFCIDICESGYADVRLVNNVWFASGYLTTKGQRKLTEQPGPRCILAADLLLKFLNLLTRLS